MRKIIVLSILAAAIVAGGGCDISVPQNNRAKQSQSASARYTPIYPIDKSYTKFEEGTILYDYNWAAASPNMATAQQRWNKYLQDHQQAEDGFSKNYLISAKFELMRVYYLQGKSPKGDMLLRQFDVAALE